ncbi:Cof-type HAD-IIB family hydrolase [Apilactobacillus ozensis]|uniref:Cof-type HAD-IIB family hydrolase n=1 Tax=Apilactobacillus ozensis TaxID=866801 RepID=UPI0007051E77|nr:Cof-type HAD-IIB family hydrolase [Apilactobacillus ozensis]MCK8607072.1 Cof-type HAD-IIB family hydrolase [Apilactobacillus ozensis]
MIKLIALDLDNTLLNSNKNISERNEKVLKELHANGIKVVLCTGRPINAVWRYVEQLDLLGPNDYTVTFNGGMVIKNATKEVLFQDSLKLKGFKLIHDFAKANNLPLDVLDFKQVYSLTDLVKSDYKEVLNANLKFVNAKFEELPNQKYSKAIMSASAEKLDSVRSTMPDDIKNNYHIVRSQPQIMEFLKPSVNKANGLEHLLRKLDLDFNNLMTFGDAENDIEMLQAAKLGVVMDNAKDNIKKIGNDTTLDHDQDGVAYYLEKYFK